MSDNDDTQEDQSEAPEADDRSESEAPEGDSAEEKAISQKQLDQILQKRLKRQEDQLLKKYSDYDTLKADAAEYQKIKDEKSTDSERWERERNAFLATIQDREEKLKHHERSALVTDLATEKGLPKSFWKRVSGDTPEEIEEDIADIIKDLGIEPEDGKTKTPKKAAPAKKSLYGGGGENEPPDPDTDAIVAKIPRGPQFRVTRT